MAKTRNNRSAGFKAKVVLEAIRERKTVREMAIVRLLAAPRSLYTPASNLYSHA